MDEVLFNEDPFMGSDIKVVPEMSITELCSHFLQILHPEFKNVTKTSEAAVTELMSMFPDVCKQYTYEALIKTMQKCKGMTSAYLN